MKREDYYNKLMQPLWDFMVGASMLATGSICITIAVIIPFIIFGGLFIKFCK